LQGFDVLDFLQPTDNESVFLGPGEDKPRFHQHYPFRMANGVGFAIRKVHLKRLKWLAMQQLM
jgi:hypothetical protein